MYYTIQSPDLKSNNLPPSSFTRVALARVMVDIKKFDLLGSSLVFYIILK